MIRGFLVLLLALALSSSAKKYDRDDYRENWKEFEEFLRWKKHIKGLEVNSEERYPAIADERRDAEVLEDAPQRRNRVSYDTNAAALMGRYIVNQVDWTAVATFSTRKDIESYPTANVIAYSDGLLGAGSGIPYMYLTPLDFTAQDLAKDPRATLLMTLAESDYCKKKSYDPMDPRCSRIMLSGVIKEIKNASSEIDVAKRAVFGRHPWLAGMPSDHHFFFAKLKISTIVVLDNFGGPKYIPVKDYLHPPVANITEEFHRRFSISPDNSDSASYESQEDFGYQYRKPVVNRV